MTAQGTGRVASARSHASRRCAAIASLASALALALPAPAGALSDRDTIIWGGLGAGPGQLFDPRGVAASPDGVHVYVADTGNDRVVQFTSEGIFVRSWGGRGAASGRFEDPRAVATDRNGDVYVADTGNGRVQKFTEEGRFLTAWPFPAATGLATDRRGHVFTLSSFFNLVSDRTAGGVDSGGWQAFPAIQNADDSGPERRWAASSIATNPAGDVYVAATRSTFFPTCAPGSNDARENPVERVGTIRRFDAAGTLQAEGFTFAGPSSCYQGISDRVVDGVAVDPIFGLTYVAQANADELRILDPGLRGTGPGAYPVRLGRPLYPTAASYPISSLDALAFDCRGNLYATSRLSNRVVKYRALGPLPVRPNCVSRLTRLAAGGISMGAISVVLGGAGVAPGGAPPKRTLAQMGIGCQAGTCAGTIELRSLAPRFTLARSRFRIGAGDGETLSMRLTVRGRSVLGRLGRLRVRPVVFLRRRRKPVVGRVSVVKRAAALALGCAAGPTPGSGPLKATGSVFPVGARGTVDVVFSSASGAAIRRAVTVDRAGRFSVTVPAGASGEWRVDASYRGDRTHGAAQAGTCATSVPAPPPPPRQPSAITLSCPGDTPLEEPVGFSGAVVPAHVGFPVTIAFTRPDGSLLTRTATTDSLGRYSDTVSFSMAGDWRAQASWEGDSGHLGAMSEPCTVPAG